MRLTVRRFCAATAVWAVLCGVAWAGEGDLGKLAWLTGSWEGSHEGGHLEEHWTAPAGGTMLGSSRIVEGGTTVHVEFLLIEQKGAEGTLTIWLTTKKLAPMRLVEATGSRAVFQDAVGHEPPDRLIYEREAGGRLKVRLEKVRQGRASVVEFHMRRVGRQ